MNCLLPQAKKEIVYIGLGVIFLLNIIVPANYYLNRSVTYVYANETPASDSKPSSEVTGSLPEREAGVPTPAPTQAPQNTAKSVTDHIYEVFGVMEGERAVKMLTECENKTLNPQAINYNSNGSTDYGLFQINSIHGYTHEQLADPLFNTKAAYKIFRGRGWSAWTCSYVLGVKSFWQ